MQTQTRQVAFTRDNVAKCLCTQCPVQESSSCVSEMASSAPAQAEPRPGEVPKLYCSQGTAVCDDLDFSQRCICPDCSVWQESHLSNYKYCRDGDATLIG